MKAVILATNESDNLAPLTDILPGSMLPLPGKPLMAYTLEMLARSGIEEVVICLHRMGGNVEAWFGTGRRWGIHINYSLQRDTLGDAGAIKWAKSIIGERMLFLPGNALHDLDIDQLIRSHEESGCPATIVTNASAPNHTGAYIFEPELLDFIPGRETFDIETQLIPLLQKNGVGINYFDHTGYWNPVSTFQELREAQATYLTSAAAKEEDSDSHTADAAHLRYPSIPGNRFGDNVWAGKNNIIHPSVRIAPPVVIGDNCQIGKDVELGPFSIIGSNVIIDDEASIRQSCVIDKTYLGKLVNVENKIVMRNLMVDAQTGDSTHVTDPFLIGEASPPIINIGFRILWDKCLAAVLIILLSPLLLLIALLSLISTGKVFQTIERIGILPSDLISGGTVSPDRIQLKHFSTRRQNGKLALLTGWVERSGLHRLLELFSIVSGQLSFVGVKPLLPEEADLLVEDWQQQRYSFSAGFTGLWYTENNGLTQGDTALPHDIYYVAVRNFQEDLRILLKTPARWVKNLLFY